MKGMWNMALPKWATSMCRPLEVVVLALLLLAGAGCLQTQTRTQTEDEKNDPLLKVTTIGDITDIGNYKPLVIQGVGLVTGLRGTGGNPPPGELRQVLEKDLRQKNVKNVKQVLESRDTAMVIVQAVIPPGVRKGDLIDVRVTLPPHSRATSLRGGYLENCLLHNYEAKKSINPKYRGRNSLLQGHTLGRAHGPVLVGLNAANGKSSDVRTGRVWDGGVTFIDRPYFFVLKKNREAARFSYAVAKRLNSMYQDDAYKQQAAMRFKRLLALGEVTKRMNEQFKKSLLTTSDIAKPNKNYFIYVNVPWEYRLNHKRFLLVTRHIPLVETADTRQPYRQRLKSMLFKPEQTVRAAVRLEALGKESVPVLQDGLKNKNPLVRFSCAEALAYLGSSDGIEELARLTIHRDLRAFCLTALASLDQPFSQEKLTDLLSSPNIQTRYGAFRALQLLGSDDPRIKGELLKNTFWLHRVAENAEPAVHYSLHRRAEVVLFGKDAYLRPPFRIRAGKEYNLTAAADDRRCTITRYDYQHDRVVPKQCSLKLDDVMRTLAELGASYPDVVDLLREVHDRHCLNCGVALNAMPQAMDVQELAKKGRDPNFLKDPEAIEALSGGSYRLPASAIRQVSATEEE